MNKNASSPSPSPSPNKKYGFQNNNLGYRKGTKAII